MSGDGDEFWSALPPRAMHPIRVPILEALRWIGEPLSAIETVDVLDGYLSMWEAIHHLRALEALGVIESVTAGWRPRRSNLGDFDMPYRLVREVGDDG